MSSKQNIPSFPMPTGHLQTVEFTGPPDLNGRPTYRGVGVVRKTRRKWGHQVKPSPPWDWNQKEWVHWDRAGKAGAAAQAGKAIVLLSCPPTPPGCQPGNNAAQVTQTHMSASWALDMANGKSDWGGAKGECPHTNPIKEKGKAKCPKLEVRMENKHRQKL